MYKAIFWSCLAVKTGTVLLQPSLKQVKVDISGNIDLNHFLSPYISWKGICNGEKVSLLSKESTPDLSGNHNCVAFQELY